VKLTTGSVLVSSTQFSGNVRKKHKKKILLREIFKILLTTDSVLVSRGKSVSRAKFFLSLRQKKKNSNGSC